jgi:hypothetical protein
MFFSNVKIIASSVAAVVIATSSIIFAVETRYATKSEANLGYYTLSKTILESDKRSLNHEIANLNNILDDMANDNILRGQFVTILIETQTDLEDLKQELASTIRLIEELKGN